MSIVITAVREAARLRRKEGYRPGSRKNLLSCQTLFIQFALVYEVVLQTPRLDDFGTFAELLLISGRSPAMVKNYLSAVTLFFQEWQVPSVVRDLSSPAWTLIFRAIAYSAGPQPDHRLAKEGLIKPVAICDTDPSLVTLKVAPAFGFLGYLGIPNLAPPTQHSLSTQQDILLGQMSGLASRGFCSISLDENAPDPEGSHHHPTSSV